MRARFWFLVCLTITHAARADFYVSGFSSGGVYRFDDNGTPIGTGAFIAPGSGGLNLPHGVMRLPDDTLIVASAGTDEVLRYSATGQYLSKFIANGQNGVPAGTLDYPVDFAIGTGGDVFVTSQLNNRVVRFKAATGAFVSIFIPSGSVDGPSGIAWASSSNTFYVVGRFGDHVKRFDKTGAPMAAFTATGFGEPFGVAIRQADGVVYVVDGGAGSVRRVDPVSGATLSTLPTGGGFQIGARFGPAGYLYVASFGGDRILQIDSATGGYVGDRITAASAAAVGLDGPNFFSFVPRPFQLEAWRQTHFSTTANTGNAADLADPDQDGLSNLMEFAVGLNPTISQSGSPFQHGVFDGFDLGGQPAGKVMSLSHLAHRQLDANGIRLHMDWSDSLTPDDWQSDVPVTGGLDPGGDYIQVDRLIALPTQTHRFVRLRVER